MLSLFLDERLKQIKITLSLILFLILSSATLRAQSISGTVFRDYDANGGQALTEPGVFGITAKGYDATGLVSTTTTNNDGEYSLSGLGSGVLYRIEFSNIPSHLKSGANGVDSQTTVVFSASPATDVDLAVHNPDDYCQDSPRIALSCFENGSGVGNTNPGFVSFDYGIIGLSPMPQKDASVSEVGSVWGAAFRQETQTLYAASMLKRHVGFANGPGFVYMIDYSNTASPNLLGSFNLEGVNGVSVGNATRTNVVGAVSGDDQLSNSPTTANWDLDAFNKIGKISFGNIDLTGDGNVLWLMNLNGPSLISVNLDDPSNPIPSDGSNPPAAIVNEYAFADLNNVPSCVNGVFRPWALTLRDGLGYVGGVCDASSGTASNLSAHVLTFDPSNPSSGFSIPISPIALNYTREDALIIDFWSTNLSANWRPWLSSWTQVISGNSPVDFFKTATQPILSDIDFTADGSMILSFLDRFSHQAGPQNYAALSGNTSTANEPVGAGDIIHLCNIDGVFHLEGMPNCQDADPGPGIVDELVNDGPGNTGEFYFDDDWWDLNGSAKTAHLETSNGGMVHNLRSDVVVSTVYDPLFGGTNANQQGIHYYHSSGASVGSSAGGYTVVTQGGGSSTFGKAGGLGEPESICEPAPLEIGNRLWCDDDSGVAAADNNGVQDPGESGIGFVDITLICDTNGGGIGAGDDFVTIESLGDGSYLFTDSIWAAGANTNSAIIPRESLCQIRVDQSDPDLGSPTTLINTGGADAEADLRDSDGDQGELASGFSSTTFFTGHAGDNNHSFDFGFQCQIQLPVELNTFSVEVDRRTATLFWSTLSEQDNAGFEIEYARQFRDWTLAGFVEGSGTIQETQGYSFVISDLLPGQYHFRLKQVNFDGSSAFSPVVEALVEVPNNHVLEPAYPNPFNPSTTLSFAVSKRQTVKLSLYDLQGRPLRLLFTGYADPGVTQQVKLEAEGLSSGMYVVKLEGNDFVESEIVALLK